MPWARAPRWLLAALLGASPAFAQLEISQVYGAGSNAGAIYAHDYVELHNPTESPVLLSGWTLQYSGDTSSSWASTPLSGSVAPHGYFLIRASAGTALATGQVLELPAPDVTGSLPLNATAGKLALCRNATLLVGPAPVSGAIADFVGYGASAGWREPFQGGSTANNAPAPSATRAAHRRQCGGAESNDNAADFTVGFPSPRNSTCAPNQGLQGLGVALPYIVEPGRRTKLSVTPYLCALGAPALGAQVHADLTAIGGLPSQELYDDGTNGDELAGDGLHTYYAIVDPGVAVGAKHLPLVFDNGVEKGGSSLGLVISPSSTPDNDNCALAQPILGPYQPPVDTAFDLTGACVESNLIASLSTAPTSGMSNRRGLWYSVVGTGTRLTASLCASNADTVLIVMGGSCEGLTVVANGDDSGPDCVGSAASATWCTTAGETYLIWVAEFFGVAPSLASTLRISDDGVACTNAASVALCLPPTTPGALLEPEAAFGPGTTDGCDNTGGRFMDVSPGFPAAHVLGTARGYGDARDGDWYRFQAAATDSLTMTVTAQFSATISLHALGPTGGCPGTTLITAPSSKRCIPTQLVLGVVAGNWYAVRVVEAPAPIVFGGVQPGAFSTNYLLSLQLGGPPANDDCSNARVLTLGGAAMLGNLAAATLDGTASCDPLGQDLWYRVTTPATGTLRVDTCNSQTDTVLAIFDACGGNEIACNDDANVPSCDPTNSSLAVSGLPAGNYYLRVSDKALGGTFRIEASFALDNDDCQSAAPLAIPSVTQGTFGFAVPESPSLAPCTGPFPGLAQNYNYTAGVWYQMVSPIDQTVVIDTLASATDTKLWVYDGSAGCGSLGCVTANDDIRTIPFQSKLAFQAAAGVPYYLLVGPFSNGQAESEFTLTVSAHPTPANDRCWNAQVLGTPLGSVPGTLWGATGENNTSLAANPSCSPGTSIFDVWYQFVAPCSGQYSFATCGTLDTLLSVHHSCPSPSASQQVQPESASCNDDGDGICAPGSQLSVFLEQGVAYQVRVATARGEYPEGEFDLAWSSPDLDGDGTPDCLDGCPDDPLKVAPGVCGCGIPDTDSDGDGTPDCIDGCPNDPLKVDPGVCGCGIPDTDSDGDGTPDCIDGCPNDPLKLAPGVCGCGVPDTDGDGDGVPDCIDNCPLEPNPGQADCDGNGVGDTCEISSGTWPDCDLNGVPDNCDPDCNLNNYPDACDIIAGTSLDLNQNGIPDECEPSQGIRFCFGDGSGTPCPCNNFSLSGEGCANSTGRGALLYNAGSTSVFLDDAAPLAIQLPAHKPLIFFAGTVQQNGGNGIPFRDGLLCLVATKRFTAQVSSFTGVAALTQPVAKSNGLITPGSTWYFQTWFRDGQGSPCGTNANLSNGLGITFTP